MVSPDFRAVADPELSEFPAKTRPGVSRVKALSSNVCNISFTVIEFKSTFPLFSIVMV